MQGIRRLLRTPHVQLAIAETLGVNALEPVLDSLATCLSLVLTPQLEYVIAPSVLPISLTVQNPLYLQSYDAIYGAIGGVHSDPAVGILNKQVCTSIVYANGLLGLHPAPST